MARSNFRTNFSIGKSENSVVCFKTIEACNLNIGRCKQIDEYIKVYEYSWSRAFLDFGRRSFTYQN